MGGIRRDITILCGRNSLRDLHDPLRYDFWIQLAREILVEHYNVHCSPCSFGAGRAGDFIICLWQFIQEHYFPDNMIADDYTIANSTPVTLIPQLFLVAAENLRLPIVINNNNDDNHEIEEDNNNQPQYLDEYRHLENHYPQAEQEYPENDHPQLEVEEGNQAEYLEVAYEQNDNYQEEIEANLFNQDHAEDENMIENDIVPQNLIFDLPIIVPAQNQRYFNIFTERYNQIFASITAIAIRDCQNNSRFVETLLTHNSAFNSALIASVPNGFIEQEVNTINAVIPNGNFYLISSQCILLFA